MRDFLRKMKDRYDRFMDTSLGGFVAVMVSVTLFGLAFVGLFMLILWWVLSPSTVDLGHGAELKVPAGLVWVDQRSKGNGIVVQSGDNVTVTNKGHKHLTLTVSYRKPNYGILDTHAFEDLPPGKSVTFGADDRKYEGMHICVTEGEWKHNKK